MESTLFLILIAMATGMVGWAVGTLVLGLVGGGQQKLEQRLTGEGRDTAAVRQSAIIMKAVEQSPALFRHPLMQDLNRLLLQAYPDLTLGRFLAICASVGGFLFVVGFLLFQSVILPAVAGLAGAMLPLAVLKLKRSRRQALMMNQLPEALEFLSRVLRAGHSLTTGFQMMGEELPEPLATEFRRCYDQQSLGQPLEDAMHEMAARVEVDDFSFFVTAVLIQRQTGGDLAEVLDGISATVRSRIRLQQHVRAITAEGRATGYVLVVMPVILLMLMFLLNREYAGLLFTTRIGNFMLAAALVLQAIGLVAIRRIVNVTV